MIESLIAGIAACALAILIISSILTRFGLPQIIGYIISGLIIGPFGLGWISGNEVISSIGDLGLVLLLFFVGTELSVKGMLQNWRVVIGGTLLQIMISFLVCWGISSLLGWSIQQALLFSFVIVMSSTAIVLKVLDQWGEKNTKVGQNALGISIVHDVLAIPMLLILTLSSGSSVSVTQTLLNVMYGFGILFIICAIVIWRRKFFKVEEILSEYKVFAGIALCFGFAYICIQYGISGAFGGFAAGLLVSMLGKQDEYKQEISPFTTVFVAVFFLYIGTQFDIGYLLDHLVLIAVLLITVFVLNTTTMAITLKLIGNDWSESIHAAAILAHIGEFGFILLAVGLDSGIIDTDANTLISSVIILTLLIGPLWMTVVKKVMFIDAKYIAKLRSNFANHVGAHLHLYKEQITKK